MPRSKLFTTLFVALLWMITSGVFAIFAFRMAPQAYRVSNLPRRSIFPGRTRHPTR